MRVLGRPDYGRYALALAVGAIVLLPSDLGISTSAARSIAAAFGDSERVRQVLAVAFKLKIATAAAMGAIVVLLAPWIADAYGDSRLILPLRIMGLATAAQSVFALGLSSYTALRRMRTVLALATLESAAETTASIGLVAGGAGVAGAVAGRSVGYLLGAGLGVVLLAGQHGGLRGLVRERFDRCLARALSLYAGAVVLVDVVWAALSQVDVLIIGALLTNSAVASFQAPSRLLALATYPGVALSNALGPRLAKENRSSRTVGALTMSARALILVQAFAACCVLLYAREIVVVALGHRYEHTAAESVTRCLAPYVLLSGLAPLLSNSIDYAGGARRRIWIAAATLLGNVVIDVTLLPRIGPVGAAIAVDVGYTFFVGAHAVLARDLVGFAVNSLVRTLAIALGAAACMIGAAEAIRWAEAGVGGLIVGGLVGAALFVAVVITTAERSLWTTLRSGGAS